MRIGLFTDTFAPDLNGVANSTNILFHELRKQGHDAYVICPRKGTGFAEWNKDHTILGLAGVQVKQLYGYVVTTPLHTNALNEISKLNLDVIHAQTEFGVGMFARICASQLSLPVVCTYHTTYEDYTHYANLFNSDSFDAAAKKAVASLSKLYGNTATEVIAPSEKTKDLLLKYKVRTKIWVVPTGLELDKFDPKAQPKGKTEEIRLQYGISMNDTMFIYVGRIAEEKALDLVVDGFVKAAQPGSTAKLLIVGDGPDRKRLEDQVASLHAEKTVIFAGPKPSDEVQDYYRSADAFVSASLSETQGMTFIEAMASGLPLFARKDEVLDNLLVEGETGWFFQDADDLAGKISNLTKLNTEEREQMKEACLAHVEPLSSKKFGESVLKVYESAIETYRNMLEIDDIQLKNDIVTVYISDRSHSKADNLRLVMSLDSYSEEGLRKGGRISNARYLELKAKEEGVRAYQKCLNRIALKDRTKKETRDWLSAHTDCDEDTINDIVRKLEEKGFLNDERYCEESISSMKLALLGEKRIIQELKKKGISQEMIEEKLYARPDDEVINAEAFARRARLSLRDDSLRMQKNKLKNKMMLKGYSSQTADTVINRMDWCEEEKHETDTLRRCALKARKRYEKKYDGTKLRNTVFRYCAAQGYNTDDIYAVLDEMEWSE
ncbi:MAG: RecX family transcriptional regulator [Bulleidia sp.]|nr:RecX family transcriptional regulator [Bulleidia sp.]